MLNDQGEVLQQIGHYEVREKIAEGGFGVVYLAHDLRLNRAVAIKVLHPYHASEPARMARFVREAQSAAKLNHPGIVQIYDVVEIENRMALVMEYIKGHNLDVYLKNHPGLTLEDRLEIAAQIADTLYSAHEAGIIHRDVKPANVMMEENGRVKLTDFSLARLVDCSLTPLTGENNVLGTPAYMSPEQCLGKEASAQSDLYSLGVIIYQLATGNLPFEADNYLALMRQHTDTPPTPVRLIRPSLPVALERLIMRCLAKSVDKRPVSGKEVSDTLRRIVRGEMEESVDPSMIKTVDIRLPEGLENTPVPDFAAGTGQTPDTAPPLAPSQGTPATPQPMPPSPGMAMTPQPGMAMTPQPGMAMTPQPGMVMTPQPGMAMTPQPGMVMTPQPGMAMTPQPGMAMTPQPGMVMTPQPGMVMTPQPMPMQQEPGVGHPSMSYSPGMPMPPQEYQMAFPGSMPAVSTPRRGTYAILSLIVLLMTSAIIAAIVILNKNPAAPPAAALPQTTKTLRPEGPAVPSNVAALQHYVAAPDDNFEYSLHSTLKGEGYTAYVLDLASQTWHADKTIPPVWRHWLTIIVPDRVAKDKALLVLSEGFSTAERPLTEVPVLFVAMATTTKSVVAILEGYPRDAVGFHAEKGPPEELTPEMFAVASFHRFLDTRDPTWPIVCPLVKTTVRAMDAIQSYLLKDLRAEIPVEHFVLTGNANGWAIWLTGAVDGRVAGIAPMQFDLLNITAQIKHQIGFQNELSPFLTLFGDMDLLPALDSQEGELLLRIIDPYAYREQLMMPKLVLLPSCANAYTTIDGVNLYMSDLKGDLSLFCAPNIAFDRRNPFLPQQVNLLSEGESAVHQTLVQDFRDTLQVFYHRVLVGKPMPKCSWTFTPDGDFTAHSSESPVEACLWYASSETRDFRSTAETKSWQMKRLIESGRGQYKGRVETANAPFTAFYVEFLFSSMLGTNYSLTTPAAIVSAKDKPSRGADWEPTPVRSDTRGLSLRGGLSVERSGENNFGE